MFQEKNVQYCLYQEKNNKPLSDDQRMVRRKALTGNDDIRLVLPEKGNPVTMLKIFSNPDVREEEIEAAAKKAGWNEHALVKAILLSLFDMKDIRKDFYQKYNVLRLFINDRRSEISLVEYVLEHLITIHNIYLPDLLNGLNKEGILSDVVLINHYRKSRCPFVHCLGTKLYGTKY